MKDIAIKVENLGKCYRLGAKEEKQDSIVASIADVIRSPIKNYRKYRSLYNFDESDAGSANILQALNDVSFEVKAGERIGIIGGNGAGKSTLLKILSKITPPTSGKTTIKGRVSSLLEVGTGFHPELTGRENIYLNGTILGMRKKEVDRKFDEIVDFSGVDEFLDTPVKRYSSGMRVRLAFAVAAHLEPEILIVDEVLAVGDANFQHKCLNKMENVAQSGRTVLFVSHNMAAITQLCERALWLEKGHLKQEGSVDEIVTAYLSAGTAGHSTWVPEEGKELIVAGEVKMLGAKLNNPNDVKLGSIANFDSPLELQIRYEITKPSRNVKIFYRVSDMSGNLIFTSMDTDSPVSHGQLRDAGEYESITRIGGFLRPGRYNITIGAKGGVQRLDQFENVLTFDVSSQGCPMVPVNRKGIITPVLDWQIKSL